MLDNDLIKKMTNEIAVTEKEIDSLLKAAEKARIQIEEDREKILDLEEQKIALEQKVQIEGNTLREHAGKRTWLERKIQKLNADLKADAHEKEVSSLYRQQPDFFTVLKARYETQIEELNSGLENFSTYLGSDEFCEKIKQLSDSSGFSSSLVAMRDAKTEYENLIKEFCEMKIKKQNIPANTLQGRFVILDRLIFMREVEAIWNVQ